MVSIKNNETGPLSKTIQDPVVSTTNKEESPSLIQELTKHTSFRLFNQQSYFLSDYPYSVQSMRNPAIVVIGCRRLGMLQESIRSLSKMKSIHAYTLYVSFGCPESLSIRDASVTASLTAIYSSLRFLQYVDPPNSEILPPFLRIQNHYVFILKEVFETYNHSEVILLEDDLMLSPDLLNYFEQTFQLLYQDPTLLCISAYNDNAYLFFLSSL